MEKSKIEKFEDLMVWQEGRAISIPSNIAEGFDRQTNKEFIQFLYIAKGSCAEVRTQLYLAEKVNILSKEKVDPLLNQTNKISAMITKLIKTRKENF